MRPQLELLAMMPGKAGGSQIPRRGRFIVPSADLSMETSRSPIEGRMLHRGEGGWEGKGWPLWLPIGHQQKELYPNNQPLIYVRSWWHALLLLTLLLLSIALYVWLFNAALPGDTKITPFLSVWVICFLPYFAACALVLATRPTIGHWRWIELGIILVGALILRAILLPLPPNLSRDSWRYVWDARVILHGYSPYIYAPADKVLTPLRDALIFGNSRFRDVPTIYPPGAELIYVLGYLLAPSNLFVLKGIFVGFDMLTCAALALLLMRKGLDPRRIIIYAWCPLPIIEFALEGHVDVLTLTFTILAILTATSTRPGNRILTGIFIGLATLTKIYPILLLIAVVRRRDTPKDWIALLLACFTTIILGYIPFLILSHGLQVFGFFFTYANQQGANAGIVQLLTDLTLQPLHLKLAPTTLIKHIVDLILLGTLSIVVLVQRLRERISMETATLLLLGTTLAISSYVFPWYITSLLPWVVLLIAPLWTHRKLNGKGLAIAMAWYLPIASLFSYFLNASSSWIPYYILAYGLTLIGLGVAAIHKRQFNKDSLPSL